MLTAAPLPAAGAGSAIGVPSFTDVPSAVSAAKRLQTASDRLVDAAAGVVIDNEYPTARVLAEAQAASAAVSEPVENHNVPLSKLMELVKDDALSRIDIYDAGQTALVQTGEGGHLERLTVELPGLSPSFVEFLLEHSVTLAMHKPHYPKEPEVHPAILAAGVVVYFATLAGAATLLTDGLLSLLGFRSRAEVQVEPNTGVRFSDIAGADEVKEELADIKQFLKDPSKFAAVGAQAPRGVLLTGPPGTGKTFMARALAGEAGVPIIQVSGAEFVQMFVGVGAARVRDVFRKAKEHSPCIIFIDEIESIAKKRRDKGGHRLQAEREQTLNQLLTEMDGFGSDQNLIVVAATNRADSLDSAVLRPGRFDRKVSVGLPTMEGRLDIIKSHSANKVFAEDVDFADFARGTTGFSAAELANAVNESAILAVRRKRSDISRAEINDAIDRTMGGVREGRNLDAKSREHFAYYFAAQALIRVLMNEDEVLRRIMLTPQKGHESTLAASIFEKEDGFVPMSEIRASITALMGGRAAECLGFGPLKVTSAAASDLRSAERLARAMVTQYGMSDFGYMSIKEGGWRPTVSENLMASIEASTGKILQDCFERARTLLADHSASLDRVAAELMDKEILSADRVRELVRQGLDEDTSEHSDFEVSSPGAV